MSELQGIARFKFHEGKLEEFKRLSAQCMEIVRTKDTGTLQYDIYFNDDQSECIVLERYRDSETSRSGLCVGQDETDKSSLSGSFPETSIRYDGKG